jgi:ABC-type Mn2+/Zn2+ transport system ATPase subunit
MLGGGPREFSAVELKNREAVQKSVVALRRLKPGETLALEDLGLLRPGTGIPPRHLKNLVGRQAACDIPEGACVGVIGSNGSGKTTFVKTILGLVALLSGSYIWPTNPTFGYVPQENRLNPLFPITVMDLLKMGYLPNLPRFQFTSSEFNAAAERVMDVLEIAPLKTRLVRELSGGQRQRTLIARALITQPRVLILDEPLNSLDYAFKQKLWGLLTELRKKENMSIVLIEHDLNRVINHVDWMMLLGTSGTLYGPTQDVMDESNLSDVFQTPVQILRGSHDQIQVQFL